MWDAGSGLSRTLGLAASPAAPSVFISLPPQLRFPGPSFEHSLPASAALLAARLLVPPWLAAPQPWRNPSSLQPGGALPHLHSLEQSWGSRPWAVIPAAQRTCCSPAQLALACLCPAGRVPSLPSTLQPPTKVGRVPHHLAHTPVLPPAFSLGRWPTFLLHGDGRNQSPPGTASVSPTLIQRQRLPLLLDPSARVLSALPHPLDPEWPLTCTHLSVQLPSPSRVFPSAPEKAQISHSVKNPSAGASAFTLTICPLSPAPTPAHPMSPVCFQPSLHSPQGSDQGHR